MTTRFRNNPPAQAVNTPLYRVTVTTITDGNLQQTLWDYVEVFDDDPATGISLVATAFASTVLTWYKACLTAQSLITGVTVADLNPGVTPTYQSNPSLAGTQSGSYLPLINQANIEWGSTLKGQHGRGRTQMPAVPVAFTTPATDPNILNAAGITAYDNLALAGLLQLTLATGRPALPCITTRPLRPEQPLPPLPPIPTPLPNRAQHKTAYVVRELLGTQRRRFPGRGI